MKRRLIVWVGMSAGFILASRLSVSPHHVLSVAIPVIIFCGVTLLLDFLVEKAGFFE